MYRGSYSKITIKTKVGCIEVLRHFNSTGHIMAVGDAHVFPGFLTPVLTQLSFQSQPLLFSHASADVRGESTLERKFVSTGSRTHNHQVMSSLNTNRPIPYQHQASSVFRRLALELLSVT